MKQILTIICIGSLALGFTAQGVETSDQPTVKKGRKAQTVEKTTATTRGGNHARQVKAQRSSSTVRSNRASYNSTSPKRSSALVGENNLRKTPTHAARERSVRSANEVRAQKNLTVNRDRNVAVNRDRNLTVNRDRNLGVNRQRNINRERNITINRHRNVTITNNWRGDRFRGQQYAAFRNYHREWHNRDWWTSHHSRIVFVFGAPYYWNSGYWYPAWGYNPGYYYPYDGPIYGYNNLAPDQVVVNVQAQLQRDGYYDGPIDGVLGPMTRQAIAAFQADNGLAVTSAVDEPTLATLGLV
jgi:putative peptidoglycan binding protein